MRYLRDVLWDGGVRVPGIRTAAGVCVAIGICVVVTAAAAVPARRAARVDPALTLREG